MTVEWKDGSTCPRTGKPFWAYLYDSGIRLLRFGTKEEWAAAEGGSPDEYLDCFVEVDDESEQWEPKFWCEYEEIPVPGVR